MIGRANEWSFSKLVVDENKFNLVIFINIHKKNNTQVCVYRMQIVTNMAVIVPLEQVSVERKIDNWSIYSFELKKLTGIFVKVEQISVI